MSLKPAEPLLLTLEQTCRSRLYWRPYALAERMILALCLGLQGENALALQEWDEALFESQRTGDLLALESCLGFMRVLHPAEIQNLQLSWKESQVDPVIRTTSSSRASCYPLF